MATRSRTAAAAALFVGLAGSPAHGFDLGADPAELVTDRPDQTESAEIVPARSLQIEVGGLITEADGRERTREGPGTLLRYGLARRLELRLAWPGRVEIEPRREAGGGRVSGTGDPEVGFKLALAEERGTLPITALLVHATLPVGDERFGSPRADLSVRLAAAHTLGARTGLGWNLGIESASLEDERGEAHTLTRFVYSTAFGYDLGERWGLFVELFGDLPASDPEPAAHAIDGGVTFALRPGVQLDAAAGFGYSGGAPDFFAGLGLSLRFDR